MPGSNLFRERMLVSGKPRALVVFLSVAFFLTLAHARGTVCQCTVKTEHGGVSVYYAGKVRLVGGIPLLESGSYTVNGVRVRRNEVDYQTFSKPIRLRIMKNGGGSVVSLFLSPNGNESDSGNCFIGYFFKMIPGFTVGLSLWNPGAGGAWTVPHKIDSVGRLETDRVQFFYWKYSDGVYGAAMPLSGKGYRTTLGQYDGNFGSKSVSYFSGMKEKGIPQMAIGFGRDPYKLFSRLYRAGLESIGKGGNLITHKKFPKVFEKIGWCSWDASLPGRKLNEELVLNSAKSFAEHKFPVKWFLFDDGWFDETNTQRKLNSFCPNKIKFPNGFRPVISTLEKEYHISDVGVWHALDGYWNGIDPDSPLGTKYRRYFFSWPKENTTPTGRNYFITPDSKGIREFYDDFESSLSDQGFSFVKVDNQSVLRSMAPGNFPIFRGGEEFHEALNTAVAKYFRNRIINCMAMTPEAYLNFGPTAIARDGDDYTPQYDKTHPRNFWFERAGQHVLDEMYNSIYFSNMVYLDFDEFESINPAAPLYAIADAMNNGPAYITDKPWQHDFDVLWPLICSNGTLLHSGKAPLPTEDCLFTVDSQKAFKAFSTDRYAGLIGVWNCVDSNEVSGSVKPIDVHGIKGEEFAVYEYFTETLKMAGRRQSIQFTLPGYGCRLFYVVPLTDGNGALGLLDKYNAPASVLREKATSNELSVTLDEGGKFAAVVNAMPASVKVDGKESKFNYDHHLLTLVIPASKKAVRVRIIINMKSRGTH